MARRSKDSTLPDPMDAPQDLKSIYASAFADTGWKPAVEKIKKIVAVPTVLYDFNYASLVGGLPVGRIFTVMGPSSNGKSMFLQALFKSFLDRMLPVGFIDAERTTDPSMVSAIFGKPLSEFPHFVKPDSILNYEDAVKHTDLFMAKSRYFMEKIPGYIGGLIGVDSVGKLLPESAIEDSLKELTLKKAEASADTMAKGHYGRNQARINQDWLNRLTAQTDESNVSMVWIAQERKEVDDYGNVSYKPKGGDAVWFDSSGIYRIVKPKGKKGLIYPGGRETEKAIGSLHQVLILKTKFGNLEETMYTKANFYWSFGNGPVPKGLDKWRDLLEVAIKEEVNIIQPNGNNTWFSFGDKRWQGKDATIRALYEDAGLFAEVEAAVMENEELTRTTRRNDLYVEDPNTGEIVEVGSN
jgi:RecA/RadA recombinase